MSDDQRFEREEPLAATEGTPPAQTPETSVFTDIGRQPAVRAALRIGAIAAGDPVHGGHTALEDLAGIRKPPGK